MQPTIQFRTEQQAGDHTYTVEIRTGRDSAQQRVSVELIGAQQDGTVIAEGGLILPIGDLLTAGQLLEQTLHGLAIVHNGGKPAAKPRKSPSNAGTPWTKAQDTELQQRWLAGDASIADLSTHFGRSRWAIRARLIHVGCDPDQSGPPIQPDTPDPKVEHRFD